ncbi:MAG: Ig-like domain-containing protein, partial [Longimicrobiales bacterium]
MIRNLRFALACLAVMVAGCTEGGVQPTSDRVAFALRPYFASARSSSSQLPINRIRLTATDAGTGAVLERLVLTVDPAESEWDIRFSFDPGTSTRVTILIELINEGPNGETVEWTGRTAAIDVTDGMVQEVPVVVYPGPPANLLVTGIDITNGPVQMLEDESLLLLANVSAPPGTNFRLSWQSATPTVATVDVNGQVRAVAAGSAMIVVTAGAVDDTIRFVVLPRARDITVNPARIDADRIGAVTQLVATIRDARGAAIVGAGVNFTVANPLVLAHRGAGIFEAVGTGVTTVTAFASADPSVSVTIPVTVQPRPARVLVTPASSVLDARGASVQLTAVVQDASGSDIPSAPVSWTTTDASVATVDASGRVTGVNDGLVTITATATGVAGAVGTAQVRVQRVARSLIVLSGNTQTGPAGSILPAPVSVRVADANGNGMAGIAVAFSVVQGGGSLATLSATSDANGIASAGSWRLGSAAGTNVVTATAAGVPAVTLTATATAGAATRAVILNGDNQSGPAGTALPVQPSIRLTDALNNPVVGVQVVFAVTAGGGSVAAPQAVSNSDGVATAGVWTLGTARGTNTLSATVSGLAPLSFTATATSGGASAMVIVQGNGQTAPVGSAVAIPPAVRITDAFGNPVANSSVIFTIQNGGGAVTPTVVNTDADGIARVASWTLGATPGINTLRATHATAGALDFTATAVTGAPERLTIVGGDAQTATVGTNVAVRPAVRLTDARGNPIAEQIVTFSVASGNGSIVGSTVLTDADGVARITSWTLGNAPGQNTLSATAPGLVAVTFTATATVGAPASVTIFAGDNQTATVSTAVAVAPAVRITDSLGNPIAGVSMAFAVASGGGTVTGTPATTDVNGVAAAASWTLSATPGAHTISATVTGLTPVTFRATAVAAAASSLTILDGDAQSASAGSAVAIAPAVKVTDSFGNGIAGVSVTFAVASGGGSVAGSPVTTDANGVARVTSWTLGSSAGANTLTASATGLQAVTFTATGTVTGTASTMSVLDGDGQSAVAGTTVTTAPAVLVKDGSGNPLAGVSVSFTPSGNGIVAGSPVVSNASGIARVTSWTLGTTAGANTLTASAAGMTDVTFNATGTPGAAATLSIAEGNAQSATVGTAVATPPAVRITDANGNAVAGVSVSFTVAGGGGTVVGSPATTGATGIARVTSWTLGSAPGANSLSAASSGLTTVQFTATAVGGTPTSLAKYEGDLQSAATGTAVTTAPAVRITDGLGNPVSGISVTFTVTGGGGTITGSPAVTDASGIARVTSWTLGSAGTNTVSAAAAGLAAVTFSATATGGAAAISLALPSGHVGVSFTAPLNVTLTQPAPTGGLTVTVTSSDPTKLTVQQSGTLVIAAGSSSGSIVLRGEAAGTVTVQASATGYTSASISVPVSLRLISLPVTLNVPFGGTASVPVTLAEPAPTGGTTVTLTSSDPAAVEVLTPTVLVPAGAISVNGSVRGVYPGTATLTATATNYINATSSARTAANLDITVSQVNINESFGATITIRFQSLGSAVAAPAGGITVSLVSVDAACATAPATVTIAAGLTETTAPITYGGTATTPCFTRVRATSPNVTPDSVYANVQTRPVVQISAQTVGSGLQVGRSSTYLGASNHGGTVVHLVSSDPTKVLLSATSNAVGSATLDIPVAANNNDVFYYVQALENVTGAVPITASAPGFTSGTASVTVVPSLVELAFVPATLATLSGVRNIQAQVGIPCGGTTICSVLPVRAGATAPVVTFSLPAGTTAATLSTSTSSGTTATAQIAPGSGFTPLGVAQGGVGFTPQEAGTVTISVSSPGFVTTTNSAKTVTITSASISASNTTVGSGLMTFRNSANLGASQHGGVIVRVTSSDPSKVLVSVDQNTAGTAFVDVNVPNFNTSVNYYVHGVEGVTGTVPITVAAPGFTTATPDVVVVQTGVQLTNLNTTVTSLAANQSFYASVGIPSSDASYLSQVQNVRAGASPLVVNFASSTTTVAQLVPSTTGGATASAMITAGTYYTPPSGVNGVALDPVGPGTTTVSASSPGLITTANASQVVTVTAPAITGNFYDV